MTHETNPSLRAFAQEVGAHVASQLQTQMQKPDTVTPEYLTPRQTAQLIGFSLRALEAMRARRIGPAFVKVGKAKNGPIRYRLEDVRAWMLANREVTDVAR
jgi:hypothetical protein